MLLNVTMSCMVLSAGGPPDDARTAWTARHVEHLWNRSGFGASSAEIRRGVALGREALVRELVDGAGVTERGAWIDVEPVLFRWEDFGLDILQVTLPGAPYFEKPTDEQVGMCKDARVVDRNQFLELQRAWFASMCAGDDPLRDRMTFLWHGHFTTSWEVVKRKYEIIHQFQWLRRTSLGSYADLLHGIVRDPAMLQFLDQTASTKEHPNENLARELFELFSLGEGNYTEFDVREAARALTGNRCAPDGSFEFASEVHDGGEKSILGGVARFRDVDLVDRILAQPACARHVARRLLVWFEGVEPDAARLDHYAGRLRDARYELRPFLRELFLDPDFYRGDAVGTRVLSPLEYLTFACRKLDLQPDGHVLNKAGVILGQSFYWPPSVKGWPEGLDWITNDALLRRSNVLGALLGALEPVRNGTTESRVDDDRMESMTTVVATAPDLEVLLDTLGGKRWTPPAGLVAGLAGLSSRGDETIARHLLEEWLPGEPTPESVSLVRTWIHDESARVGASEGAWIEDEALRTALLRRLAHLVFSLPEAHLG